MTLLICGDGGVCSIHSWDVMRGRNVVIAVGEGGMSSGFDEMGRDKAGSFF